MNRNRITVGLLVVGWLAATAASAQSGEAEPTQAAEATRAEQAAAAEAAEAAEISAGYERVVQELERARAQLERSRAEMEEAARVIAVAPAPPAEPGRFIVRSNYPGMHGALLGATIVDAANGVLVTGLTPDGSADTAGVMVGDVIVEIDGVGLAIESPAASLLEQLAETGSGEAVELVVERAGENFTFTVEVPPSANNLPGDFFVERQLRELHELRLGDTVARLEELQRLQPLSPASPANPTGIAMTPVAGIVRTISFSRGPWGDMELVTMTEQLGRYFDTAAGLLVVRAPAEPDVDIEDGDVILAISGRTPNSPEHAIRILGSFEPGETIEFGLMRNGQRETVEYLVPELQTLMAPVAAPAPPDSP